MVLKNSPFTRDMNDKTDENRSPWGALESVPGQSAVPALWRERLGAHYEAFQAAFLQPAAEPARSYPCPRGCGCRHEIVRHPEGDLVAVCRCEPRQCDALLLAPEAVVLWKLSWPRLSRALVAALELDAKPAELHVDHTRQIGSWSSDCVPVLLSVQHAPEGFRLVVTELAGRLRQPFILLGPTARFLDAPAQEVLRGVGAAFFSLETTVRCAAHGALQPVCRPGELFSRFAPAPQEQLAEEAARNAFALVKALDADQPAGKAALYTVFRLYCVEGLTVQQVAKRCRCARSLVFVRLNALRRKLGTDLKQLRAYSGHFERIEAALTDPRARRIHRPTAALGDADAAEDA